MEDAVEKITTAEARVRKPFIDELKVKDALIEQLLHRDKDILKQLKILKAILRTPRMYGEMREAVTRHNSTRHLHNLEHWRQLRTASGNGSALMVHGEVVKVGNGQDSPKSGSSRSCDDRDS